MDIHLLGIRHHGPGSCRHVVESLQQLQPDLILLEGPPEAEPLIREVIHPQMTPPVALLAYQPDQPHHAVFYPFAEFSPEWQTLKYAVSNGVELRFFDLPLVHSMALRLQAAEEKSALKEEKEKTEDDPQAVATETEEPKDTDTPEVSLPEVVPEDPFNWLARASGHSDGEAWWEANIEHRIDGENIFEAVKEAVTALREELPEATSARDLLREAWMRKMLRTAQKENFQRIVVVCGAWHVPAFTKMPTAKEDNEVLKGLPKIKVECTWIPWSYDRLSYRSGYGAGIHAPGWYDHIWHHPTDDGTLWVSRAAGLLRDKQMDISVAHVIETVRLAQATAALRHLPAPSLQEFNEAITTVMGFGDDILLAIIREEQVISNRLGSVPDHVPKVPLLVDVEKHQKKLRLPFTSEIKELNLDLRKPGDLERSIFLHRLRLLEITWGKETTSGKGKGTFKEQWTLYHQPEQIIAIIEKAIWGNTVEDATRSWLVKQTAEIDRIPRLTHLLVDVIPADLPQLVEALTARLDALSAATGDILEMMEAVPDLVQIVRYGSVRDLDFSKVGDMLQAMVARILAGGLLVCINIDEEAASEVLDKLAATDYALSTANRAELSEMWLALIRQIRGSQASHPLLSGYATRLLYDKGQITAEEMQKTLSFYASVGNTPADMAYWFEGFLRSSGTILLLDENLWSLINHWISSHPEETFMELLPILRRTFGEFTEAERRKLGEKAKGGGRQTTIPTTGTAFRLEDAQRVIPLMKQLIGIDTKQ